MRALKILVVVLGVLLLGGTVALVAAVVARIEHRAAPALARRDDGRLRTVLAPRGRVIATELSGDRLLVRLARADGGENLVLFDARTGAELAVIAVPPAASGSAGSDARDP